MFLVRIANPKYNGGEDGLDKALRHMKLRGTKFLAYHRNGTICNFEELPPLLQSMTMVPSDFRMVDVSSTEIRKAGSQ